MKRTKGIRRGFHPFHVVPFGDLWLALPCRYHSRALIFLCPLTTDMPRTFAKQCVARHDERFSGKILPGPAGPKRLTNDHISPEQSLIPYFSFCAFAFGHAIGFLDGSETASFAPFCCCALRSAAIAFRSKPNFSACAFRTLRTSSTIGSFHILHLHQLQRGTDNWRFITLQPANHLDIRPHRCIGTIFEIPAGSCGQVADYAGFNIDPGLHAFIIQPVISHLPADEITVILTCHAPLRSTPSAAEWARCVARP